MRNQKFKPNGDPVDVVVPGMFMEQVGGDDYMVVTYPRGRGRGYNVLFRGTRDGVQDFLRSLS